MSKYLYGNEIADFIKQRQLRQVRNLKQQFKIYPKLLILKSPEVSPVIDTYIRMKELYAEDLGILVETKGLDADQMGSAIDSANADASIHGIIIQLPIREIDQTDELVGRIISSKDVDGLGKNPDFLSATAEAIDWLVAGHNIDLTDKKIVLLGRGRLIGVPLEALWLARGLDVQTIDKDSDSSSDILVQADLIVSATGVPNRLRSADVKRRAIIIDAGTTSESGVIVGDASSDLRVRDDIKITPEKGGVGPLTIAVLFDHVINSALSQANKK